MAFYLFLPTPVYQVFELNNSNLFVSVLLMLLVNSCMNWHSLFLNPLKETTKKTGKARVDVSDVFKKIELENKGKKPFRLSLSIRENQTRV